ncbi:MAG: hypothetical protein ACYTF7_10290 [Planctomycetota bacterium]|jgi:tetratricopeptide (TPR) repeat protein
MRLITSLLMAWLLAIPALAQDDDATLLAQAESAFEQGHAMLDSDPRAARAHYTRSALLFERLINEHSYDNANAHYNHANALLLSGQPGRAIAAYLRAQRLRPHDSNIQAGLADARNQSAVQVPPSTGTRLTDVITIWRGIIPRPLLLWTSIIAWLSLWSALFLRTRKARLATPGLITTAALVSVVCAGSLILEQTLLYSEPVAVVVIDDTPAYNVPDTRVYNQTFTTPLSQGIECIILEQRDGWVRVELGSGDQTWVRSESIERV